MLGNDVHPSETGSTGKPILKSIYTKPGDRKENYIECAQCGYVIDLDKVATGDSLGSVTSFISKSTIVTLPTPSNKPVISYADRYADPQRTAGCPLCGTMNPKGAGFNKSWGNSKDLSDL